MPPARSMRSSAALVSVVLRFACPIGDSIQVRREVAERGVCTGDERVTSRDDADQRAVAQRSDDELAGLGVVQVSGGDDARPSRSGRERVSGRRGTDLVADNCDRPDDADPRAPPHRRAGAGHRLQRGAESEQRARHLQRVVSYLPLPKLPAVFGPDSAGVVAAVGNQVTDVAVGDRVYVNPGISCGGCRAWRQGQDQNCDRYTFMGYFSFGADGQQIFDAYPYGGLGEYLTAPQRNLVSLPDSVSFTWVAGLVRTEPRRRPNHPRSQRWSASTRRLRLRLVHTYG